MSASKLNCSELQDHKKNETLSAVASAGLTAKEAAINAQSDEVKAMIAAEQRIAPVGEDFIEAEKDAHGKKLESLVK